MNNKFAVITGAASGMGKCYALQLAEKGYGIVVVDINDAAAHELSNEITSRYGVAAPVMCLDLTLDDAAELIVGQCRENGWQVEILINNAGMLTTTSIMDTTPESMKHMIALHCTTPLLLCRQLVPFMIEQEKGYILNVSSITAWMDWPVIGMYGCTKRFVKGFSRALHIECMGTPVSVTTAIFGAVDTPMVDSLSPRLRKLMLCLGFMLTPEKAARRALKAMFKRKATMIPCMSDRLAIALSPLLPDCLLHALAKKYAHKLFEH